MEPLEGVRVPVDVLGENEALQQFFDGKTWWSTANEMTLDLFHFSSGLFLVLCDIIHLGIT